MSVKIKPTLTLQQKVLQLICLQKTSNHFIRKGKIFAILLITEKKKETQYRNTTVKTLRNNALVLWTILKSSQVTVHVIHCEHIRRNITIKLVSQSGQMHKHSWRD